MAKPNTYELNVNPNYVDSLTAGSLAVSDFRHDFFGASLLGAEKTKSFETTLNEVKNMLPRCPGWDKELAATPADPPCNGTGGGGYRRVEDTKGMEEYLDASLTSIKAAIAAQDAPGEELELPGSVFAKLKYKVRVLSKSAEDRIERGFHDILAGHKLGFVVDTYTSTFKYLIHDSLSEPKRTYPLIWINNNATAFDPATKSYPGSGKASDKSSIGRRMISVENEEEVAAVWRDGKLPYRDMYETILYSPWPEERQNVSLNDATIENNLFFSKGDITQRRESSAPTMPLIDLNVNGIDWTIPSSSVGWISAQIQNLWLQPSSKLKKIWESKKTSKKAAQKSAEMFAQQEHAIRVSHDADEGGGGDDVDVDDDGGGGRGAHPGAASPEQFRILSDTFSNIKETPIPGFLALSKRLGDQGQALSCRRKELYSGILPVFVTIDQLAFVAAVMYNIPAAIFCGKGGKKGPGPTFMIYKESLDDPVLRLGNIIENFKSILKKPPPPLGVMDASAAAIRAHQMEIMEGEWNKISRAGLKDETQYKNFLRKIISLDATSNIIKDVTNVQKEIAKLQQQHDVRQAKIWSDLDAALSSPDSPPPLPAAAALARILKMTPNLIPEGIWDKEVRGEKVLQAKDDARQARKKQPLAILQKAAEAALGVGPKDRVTESGKLTGKATKGPESLLARAGYADAAGAALPELTRAFAEHPKLLDPLYAWLADQADEYLGYMKTLISLNNLLDAAAKSAEEQEKAEKRKLGKVNAAAINKIRLTPPKKHDQSKPKSGKTAKKPAELLTEVMGHGVIPLRVIYSGAPQLKNANNILAVIDGAQNTFQQIVEEFLNTQVTQAPATRVTQEGSKSRPNLIEQISPRDWVTTLSEFIKVDMGWTAGGGGGSGEQGGGRRKKHQKGGNKFPFKDDEIIRTYVGIVLVTISLLAESVEGEIEDKVRSEIAVTGLLEFLGEHAVDHAISAISYAMGPPAAAINDPQAPENLLQDEIEIVEGGIFSPTFYNQLKRLNLGEHNGIDLLQYLRQNILKVSNDPGLIELRGDEINIKPMVESLQRQVKTSLKAYGFTAAALAAPAAALAAPAAALAAPAAAAVQPPPQPPKSVQPFSKQAPTESTPFQKPAVKAFASQTGVDDLGSDSDSESEGGEMEEHVVRPLVWGRRVRAGKRGGKRKKKRTRRRKPKKRRKRSKKKRKPKKKQTRRRKPKKKRTRRRRR